MRRYSNDVTTLSFNDLVKNEEKEKNKYNRLESNIYLNKRDLKQSLLKVKRMSRSYFPALRYIDAKIRELNPKSIFMFGTWSGNVDMVKILNTIFTPLLMKILI